MTTKQFEQLKDIYHSLGAEALTLNHYELATRTGFADPATWKEFLMEPEIKQYVSTETAIIRNAELNKITTELKGSRSVGQAQLISALTKLGDQTASVDGPVFIYSYVPLSDDQRAASNVRVEQRDIFLKDNTPEIPIEDLEKYHLKPVYIVADIGKFWGIVNYVKQFIVVPEMPNLDFQKIIDKGIRLYPNEVL